MSVDIIIAVLTYNCERTLSLCLESLINQHYPKDRYKVIAIDNGSTDRTIEILRKYGVLWYSYPGLNIAQLRNAALLHAAAPIVGFVDSDCIVDAGWIAAGIRWFSDNRVAIVGNKYALPPQASFFEKNWYKTSNEHMPGEDLIPAGNMIVRRDVILNEFRFNEDLLTGEDADLLRRVRAKGLLAKSDSKIRNVHLGNPKDLISFFKKERWYAVGTDWRKAFVHIDKPFLFSLAFVLLSASVLPIFLFLNPAAAMAPVCGVILLCALAAADRKINKRVEGDAVFLAVAYLVYFSARASALPYIFKIKKYRASLYAGRTGGAK